MTSSPFSPLTWASPFLEPDDPSLRAMIGDAAVHLLSDRGVGGLSSRALAGHLGITPSALTQRASRAEQLRLLVIAIGQRWLSWANGRSGSGLPARLPESAEELHGLRVWRAVAELARGEAAAGRLELADLVEGFCAEQRGTLSWRLADHLERRPEPDELALTVAIVTGLSDGLIAWTPVLTHDQASRILRGHVDGLRAATAA